MTKLVHGVEFINQIIVFPKSVCAVCFLENKLLLVKQKRFRKDMLELPGGVCNPDEGIIEAALRELTEESGYLAKSGKILITLDLDTSISLHQTSLVRMQGVVYSNTAGEYPCEWYDIETLVCMINESKITHAPTVVAILMLWEQLVGERI